MAQTQTSPLDYQSELIEIWRNKRFSDAIAAKIYEGTNTSGSERSSYKLPTESKTFLTCIVEHSSCNGQIVTDNYIHHCFCPRHRFLVREEEFF
jgi:hypothetical protein